MEQAKEEQATTTRARMLLLVRRPAELFMQVAAKGGALLVLALIAGMVWKNVDGASYDGVWSLAVAIDVGAGVGRHGLHLDLLGVVNDVAMAVFFLVVGAEIKRELVVGELRGWRRASVPALAALGGMLVPALFYVVIAPAQRQGFGTPMATDIAFALAVIGLLGARVPPFVVKVLMGLAIIDDLGAIVVIAVFYGGDIDVAALGVGAGCVVVLFALNAAGVWRVVPYLVTGVPLWIALHEGGVHPTIAGVVVGLAIPARGRVGLDDVKAEARALLEDGSEAALSGLEKRLEQHQPPLERLVSSLSPWIHWLILPVFALANGGVDLGGVGTGTLFSPVSLGVIVGLVVGKQLGIFGTVMACVKSGLLSLPAGVHPRHVWGMAILGGVGFTMSLFVAALAFVPGSVEHTEAKTGILVGSSLSALLGLLVLRSAPSPSPSPSPSSPSSSSETPASSLETPA